MNNRIWAVETQNEANEWVDAVVTNSRDRARMMQRVFKLNYALHNGELPKSRIRRYVRDDSSRG